MGHGRSPARCMLLAFLLPLLVCSANASFRRPRGFPRPPSHWAPRHKALNDGTWIQTAQYGEKPGIGEHHQEGQGSGILSIASGSGNPGVVEGSAALRSDTALNAGKHENFEWRESWFSQQVDHFSFVPGSDETFQQKYVWWDAAWGGAEKSFPIFVYCGNEGPVEWFVENAGWIREIAVEFKALVVAPEHRYYGASYPFGSSQAAYASPSSRGFLTTEQAMADMAVLLTNLKANLSADTSPVVLFGGSYGGMLAAWMRLKYPHVAIGAVASSAPILQFEEVVPTDTFYNIVSKDFKLESRSCFASIVESWPLIRQRGATARGLSLLSRQFGFCRDVASVDEIIDWLEDAYVSLAMVDYPIATSFLAPLPPYPIREVCRRIDQSDASDLLDRIFDGISVYFNFTGSEKCFDPHADPHGEDGWNFQACTEQVMPMSSNTETSMFEPFEWNLTEFIDSCKQEFDVTPRPNWILTQFGGRDIKSTLKHFASNIVFSNGRLDPWSGGGVMENISDSVVSLVIPDGAHHLDLRSSTPEDPPSVRWQRQAEKGYIKKWLDEYHSATIGRTVSQTRVISTGGPSTYGGVFFSLLCFLSIAAIALLHHRAHNVDNEIITFFNI